MIVAIEAVGAKRGGAARIATEATRALASHEAFTRVVVFASPADVRAFDYPDAPNVEIVDQPGAEASSDRLSWLNRGLADAVDAVGADAVLALNAAGTVRGVPVVNYYQQPLLYDEEARRLLDGETRTRLTAIRSLTWRAAKAAAAHVVQTDWMRSVVSEAWSIPAETIDVATPTPPDWKPGEASRRGADLLWVGHRLEYKRWPLAQWIHRRWRGVEGDSILRATLDDVTGEGLEGLGTLDWKELEQHYRDVSALLVTSVCESLGLPLLEALATHCPIVAPDLPWVRSVCDNAALYYASDAPDEAVERLRDLQQTSLRDDLESRMSARVDALRRSNGWERLADTVASVV